MNRERSRYAGYVALGLILLLAALLRLGWPGVAEFKHDEAHIVALAYDLLEGQAFPLRGTETSVGIPKSALSVYLYALPLALWRSPLAATLFTGLLGTLAVLLCWWVGRRLWGNVAGLAAALCFAVGPWAVFFSRKIWEPNLLPFLAAAALALGFAALQGQRPWLFAAHIVLLGLCAQVYYPGLVVLPAALLLWLLNWRRLPWRGAWAGLAAVAVSATPFALDMVRHRDELRGEVARFAAQAGRVDGAALEAWWRTATGSGVESLAGEAQAGYLETLPPLAPAQWAMGALVVGGVALLLWRALTRWREEGAQAGLVVAAWALTPLLVYLRHASPVHTHYISAALPAQFLAAGALLAHLLSRGRRAVGLVVALLMGGVIVVQVWSVAGLLAFVSSHYTGYHGAIFGVPLGTQLRAVERARAAGWPVVVVCPGDRPLESDWPMMLTVLLRGTPHRLVDGGRAALFPGTPTTLLITPESDVAIGLYATSPLASLPAERVPCPGEGAFRIIPVGEAAMPTFRSAVERATLANGAQVLGYRLDDEIAAGRPFSWQVIWQVTTPPPDREADYHLFNHFVTASGERWGQYDGGTLPSAGWSVGDVIVQSFHMDAPASLPPGPHLLRVGMYTYPQLQGQPVVNAAGQPIADAVTLGPLER
jgi:4-amino-4-deoxy-L-arabinose transferase-like glycosyltransferase